MIPITIFKIICLRELHKTHKHKEKKNFKNKLKINTV